jgi:hypothetical protein
MNALYIVECLWSGWKTSRVMYLYTCKVYAFYILFVSCGKESWWVYTILRRGFLKAWYNSFWCAHGSVMLLPQMAVLSKCQRSFFVQVMRSSGYSTHLPE